MSLLGGLKERLVKQQPLGVRLERSRRVKELLRKYVPALSAALWFAGFGILGGLALDRYNRGTYISENALLPAQANIYYGFNDVQYAEAMRNALIDVHTESTDGRAEYLRKEFASIGLEAVKLPFNDTVYDQWGYTHQQKRHNTYGILKATRSDGTEALVLCAPWKSRTGEDNTNGIAALLSIARMFKRYTYWSKDVIFLVTEGGDTGMTSWLQSYHGEKSNSLRTMTMPRSGALQAAVVMDFPGVNEYECLGIYFEGPNGQLPNLDLINTVSRVARITAQIPVVLHNCTSTDAQSPFEKYIKSIKHVLDSARYQASGTGSGEHGIFMKYHVDAITIHGIPAEPGYQRSFGYYRIGALIESTFRSLNNLLEHFHQSFFFYYLVAPERFVSIGMYMPAMITFVAAFLFNALLLWFTPDTETADKEPATAAAQESSSKTSTKDAVTVAEAGPAVKAPLAYSTQHRDLVTPFTVLGFSFCGAILTYLVIEAPLGDARYHSAVLVVKFFCAIVINVVAIFLNIYTVAKSSNLSSTWRTLKSLCLAQASIAIAAISLVNFSQGILFALVASLPVLLIMPTQSTGSQLVQYLTLAAFHPAGMFGLLFALKGHAAVQLLRDLIISEHVLGNWLGAIIMLVYQPIVLAIWGVVGATESWQKTFSSV